MSDPSSGDPGAVPDSRPDGRADSPRESAAVRRPVSISEDWLATIVGLVLVVLALSGVIPTGLVP